ncbi:haloacid dehalogenase-like hydrolase [Mycobacterium sp. Y57]|uniref:HAD family hydrolase n=1 Tax=Mycolicibacterium xanthum TaxID=2796469 RepID=UPI001C8537B8|nr:HAD family hydrolase [Mycolicibacterium xanthum]MBX7433499.1 haloacid dehalogenase-like hydrolase [Mycolicibacterium xanthum]
MNLAVLDSWTDGPTRAAIVDFVGRVTTEGGPNYVAPDDRIAVFDNDGTLWVEKPAYIQLDFLVRRFAEQAATDPSLADKQPYKAAVSGQLGWIGEAVTMHYQGDDSRLKELTAGIGAAHANMSTEQFADRVNAFFAEATHPTLKRSYLECTYVPMVELLHFLTDNGFTNYIASGGGRDFMRSITGPSYGVPPERVIGSSNGMSYSESDGSGHVIIGDTLDVLDDGPEKPIRIWNRIGRRPILAAGNSNGDVPMLCYTGAHGGPALRLLVLHDDAEREFDYTAGAEQSLEYAQKYGWTVVSMKSDWTTVFA